MTPGEREAQAWLERMAKWPEFDLLAMAPEIQHVARQLPKAAIVDGLVVAYVLMVGKKAYRERAE